MFRNYLVTALRFFAHQRIYSLLNLFGLTVGLSCTLLILLWVSDELKKNAFHRDLDRIFNVNAHYQMQTGGIETWRNTPGLLAEYIRESIPEVELAARTFAHRSVLFRYNDKSFLFGGMFADPEFFGIFSFKVIKGTVPKDRLDKTALMLSEKVALSLFGNEDPLGKQVKVGPDDMTVVGIFEDVSDASSLKFDFITPLQIYKELRGEGFNWGNFDHWLYLRLKDPKEEQAVAQKINQKFQDLAKATNEKISLTFFLTPFSEVYLHSEYKNGVEAGGRILYVKIFIVVACFILLIACVNFTNMATARALNRSKEIGVRKVVGADRKFIILQFLGESLLMSLAAMVFALIITWAVLPYFNLLVEKNIVLQWLDPLFLPGIVSIVILTGTLAGGYPALFMSGFKPTHVLKGVMTHGVKGNALRRWLVTFQFSIAVLLIISAAVIFQQIEYLRTRNPGYNRDAVMKFNATGAIMEKFDAFSLAAGQLDGIVSVTRANESLVSVNNSSSSVVWPGKDDQNDQLFAVVMVDYNFIETLKLTVTRGRSFSRDFHDENNIIISERAASVMGLADPVGQKLSVWDREEGTVVGVVRDLQTSSALKSVNPVVLLCRPSEARQVYIKYDAHLTDAVIASMTDLFKKYSPEYPFDYKFMDEDFESMYKSERIAGSLALGFTSMAVIISILGMLGLAAYTAERKRKEISIRKTLGAEVAGLVVTITSGFVRISVIASAIGSAASYYLMSNYLDSYTFRVEISWTVFACTLAGVIFLAAASVTFQVTRAALANPAEVLRSE